MRSDICKYENNYLSLPGLPADIPVPVLPVPAGEEGGPGGLPHLPQLLHGRQQAGGRLPQGDVPAGEAAEGLPPVHHPQGGGGGGLPGGLPGLLQLQVPGRPGGGQEDTASGKAQTRKVTEMDNISQKSPDFWQLSATSLCHL